MSLLDYIKTRRLRQGSLGLTAIENWHSMWILAVFTTVVGAAISGLAGWTLIGAHTGDRWNIIVRSVEIYEFVNPMMAGGGESITWLLYDPPLRYLPWILSYVFVGVENAPYAGFATTVFFGLVVLPLAATAFGYYVSGPTAAGYSLAVIVFLLDTPVTIFAWADNWHYVTPLPFVVIALLFIERSVQTDHDWKRSLLAGVAVGLVGMQQIIYGGLLVSILVTTYLLRGRVKSLAYALPGVGVCFGYLPWYFSLQNQLHTEHATDYLTLNDLPGMAKSIIELFSPDRGFFMLIFILLAVYTYRRHSSVQTTLQAAVIVLGISYFLSRITLAYNWVPRLIYYLSQVIFPVSMVSVWSSNLPAIRNPKVFLVAATAIIFGYLSFFGNLAAVFPVS